MIAQKRVMDSFRHRLHEIIFEADTPKGKVFNLGLIFCICISVFIVMMDSVAIYHAAFGDTLYKIEWAFTKIGRAHV